MFWGVKFTEYGQAVYEAGEQNVDIEEMDAALFDDVFRISPDLLKVLDDPFFLSQKDYLVVRGQVFQISSRKEEEKVLIASFDELVEKVIPLPGRDLLVVVTEENIFAVHTSGDMVRKISSRDKKSPIFYASYRDELFWQWDNHIYSFWFSASGEREEQD